MNLAGDYDIIGIGVSLLDLLTRVDHFPAEEGVQRTDECTLQGGGPVSTAIVTAAKLGARTAMIDRVAMDWRGDRIMAEFAEAGVDPVGLERAEGESSLASVWVRRSDGARTIAFAGSSCPEFQRGEIDLNLVSNAKILHTNGRHLDACFEAADHARKSGTKVSFDGGAGRFREEIRDFISVTDVAIVAREWAESFSGISGNLHQAAGCIIEAGPTLVCITDGIRGSWTFSTEGSFHSPAFEVEPVVDTTGCGDSFHGAFLTGLAWGWELERCARIASAVAALNARALGGRGNLVNLAEAEHFAETAPFRTQ